MKWSGPDIWGKEWLKLYDLRKKGVENETGKVSKDMLKRLDPNLRALGSQRGCYAEEWCHRGYINCLDCKEMNLKKEAEIRVKKRGPKWTLSPQKRESVGGPLDVDGRQENGSIETDFWFGHGMDSRAIRGDGKHSLGGEVGRWHQIQFGISGGWTVLRLPRATNDRFHESVAQKSHSGWTYRWEVIIQEVVPETNPWGTAEFGGKVKTGVAYKVKSGVRISPHPEGIKLCEGRSFILFYPSSWFYSQHMAQSLAESSNSVTLSWGTE